MNEAKNKINEIETNIDQTKCEIEKQIKNN